jgi:TetR/AcrR family transcriptional repressor for divergent bdcA
MLLADMGRPRAFDRDQAVDKAMLLFWRHGFDSTSLSQLKEELGISAASFYAAFGSKEDLFREAVDRYIDSYGSVSGLLWDTAMSPIEALAQSLRDTARMQTDRRHPLGCLLVVAVTTTSVESEHLQKLLGKARARIRRGVKACLVRAHEARELNESVDVETLSDVLITFLFGITTQARDGATVESLEKAVSAMMFFIRRGPSPAAAGKLR